MTYVLRIDPDGTVSRYEPGYDASAMDLANHEFEDRTSVVTLHHPLTGFRGSEPVLVGWIHDFGKMVPLPVNRKAWILYGGSPIYGTMFVADDEQKPLSEEFVRVLMSDEDWIGDAYNAAMDDWLRSAHSE